MGLVLDFRKFSTSKLESDIVIREVNFKEMIQFIGDREIFDLKMLFVNNTMKSYAVDLLMLIELQQSMQKQNYEVFGCNLPDKRTKHLECTHRKQSNPLAMRNEHIMSFLKLERSLALIVFDDGVIWHYDNDQNKGKIAEHHLTLPFKVTQVVFEAQHGIICLENESGDRIFYQYENETWQHYSLNVSSKYQVIKLFQNFLIARYQDGYAFLIEIIKGDELGLHV